MKNKTIYLVTGSSGYVASILIPELKKKGTVLSVDLVTSKYTDFISDIGSDELRKGLKNLKNTAYINRNNINITTYNKLYGAAYQI